jgi:predicted nucleic acid-binding protein
LDAGALIGVDRRSTRLQELFRDARSREMAIVVPTAVVAQAVRGGGRQASLRHFLADSGTRFVSLDYPSALEIGALLGQSGTADVVDAAVIISARRFGHCPVVTSDPEDLRKIDPSVPLITI